jgi:hypothetical protein
MESNRDDGMVTAELAVCLPVLVLLLAVALGAVSVASARIRVADVAREAARLAARSDDAGVGALVAREAPSVRITVRRSADEVTAVATAKPRLVGGTLPSITVTATAVAALEPVG